MSIIHSRKHAGLLVALSAVSILFLIVVLRFDANGGDHNSAFFLITWPLTVLSGIALFVMTFDPWDTFNKHP